MRKTLFCLFLIVQISSFAQEYLPADNFKFKFIKAKKAVGGNYVYTIKTPKSETKVQVRYKMKSISGVHEDFDPNKFYLVSDEYKVRIRPIDVRHNYAAGWIFIGFNFLIDFEPDDKVLNRYMSYKPNIKDTFFDYKIGNYQDIFPRINFGTKKKPKIAAPYLEPKELKSCKVDVYFSLPKDLKKFQVFYGETLLSDAKIK